MKKIFFEIGGLKQAIDVYVAIKYLIKVKMVVKYREVSFVLGLMKRQKPLHKLRRK